MIIGCPPSQFLDQLNISTEGKNIIIIIIIMSIYTVPQLLYMTPQRWCRQRESWRKVSCPPNSVTSVEKKLTRRSAATRSAAVSVRAKSAQTPCHVQPPSQAAPHHRIHHMPLQKYSSGFITTAFAEFKLSRAAKMSA